MTHLKNNAIALAVQTVFCLCFSLLYLSPGAIYSQSDANRILIFIAIVIVCILVYTACGFFLLRPSGTHPFLSAGGLAIFIVILHIIMLTQYYSNGYEFWDAFIIANPSICILAPLFLMDIPYTLTSYFALAVLFLAFLTPSLLIYLGMFLRKKFRKANA